MEIAETTETNRSDRNPITLRRINILLALVAVGLLFCLRGPISRRAELLLGGALEVEGNTIYLDPDDRVMTRCVLNTGSWEPTETTLIRQVLRPGDTFIDVGANVGWYTLAASDAVGPEGRVYAFEPDPTSRSLLRRNIDVNRCRNILVEGKALSDRPGTLTLHLNAANRGNHSIIESNLENAVGGAIEVEAVSLDDYLRDHPGAITLVKIDTEGAEGFILEGMRETMRQHPGMAIILEFNPIFIRQAGFDPEAMLRRLRDDGYSLQNINEAARRLEPIPGTALADFVQTVASNSYYTNIYANRPGE